jgi:hypothetical protein
MGSGSGTTATPSARRTLARQQDKREDLMPIATREDLMPRAQIKDEKTYQKLRDRGESQEKSARIANAAAATSASQVGRKGGKSAPNDDWTKQDLVERAKQIGIKGRSRMSKTELIKALRDH